MGGIGKHGHTWLLYEMNRSKAWEIATESEPKNPPKNLLNLKYSILFNMEYICISVMYSDFAKLSDE